MSTHREVSIAGPDGPIPGIAVGDGSADARPHVILLHGGGRTKQTWLDRADALARRGFVAITIDARRHGDRSDGRFDPSGPFPILDYLDMVDGTARDVSAVIDAIHEGATGCGPASVVAGWGFSLGAHTILVAAARDDRLRAVTAIGTPVKIGPYRAEDYPSSKPDPTQLAAKGNRIDLMASAAGLRDTSVLLLHGDADPYGPVEAVRQLFTAVSGRTDPDSPSDDLRPTDRGLIIFAGAHRPSEVWLDMADMARPRRGRAAAGHRGLGVRVRTVTARCTATVSDPVPQTPLSPRANRRQTGRSTESSADNRVSRTSGTRRAGDQAAAERRRAR
jgi:dienelactone hydrolase